MRSRMLFAGFFLLVAVACGPTGRDPHGIGGDGVDADPSSCVPTPEVCNDGRDNDCDGRVDCGDSDCSGIDGCPVCGAVENPESQPLALPDGVGSGQACNTDADCTDPVAPNCVAKECHGSYTSTLNFVGFGAGATLQDASHFLSVCVVMEHSWLRDLQMDLITPDQRVITLHAFVDRSGNEIHLGQANDNDTAANPVPGVGYRYCWTGQATQTMLEAPTMPIGGIFSAQRLPAGDYRSVSPFSAMVGTPLNGGWTFRVTDLWSIDNGFLFEWSIAFDPSLVSDCSGPIIE